MIEICFYCLLKIKNVSFIYIAKSRGYSQNFLVLEKIFRTEDKFSENMKLI